MTDAESPKKESSLLEKVRNVGLTIGILYGGCTAVDVLDPVPSQYAHPGLTAQPSHSGQNAGIAAVALGVAGAAAYASTDRKRKPQSEDRGGLDPNIDSRTRGIHEQDPHASTPNQKYPEMGPLYLRGPWQDFPIERPFSPPLLKFMVVPESYNQVRLKGGRAGRFTSDKEGIKEPGFSIMLGLNGLWSTAYVVPTFKQTVTIPVKVVTEDGLETDVETLLQYQVTNPRVAMLESKDYHLVARELAEAITQGFAGSRTFSAFKKTGKDENLLDYLDHSPMRLIPKNNGFEIDALQINKIDIPHALEAALAQGAIAAAQAQEIRTRADALLYDAEKTRAAANEIGNGDRFGTEVQLRKRALDVAEGLGDRQNQIVISSMDGLLGQAVIAVRDKLVKP